MRYGLLGRKLGHSYSPAIHGLLGTYPYTLLEVEPEQLADFLQKGDFTGLNVTMPYKQAVIPYLDEITPIARRLGAVNTIVRRNGRLIGHNTDHAGFLYLVKKSGFPICGKKVLVLGSGGASKTCAAVLQTLGASVTMISRTGKDNYTNLDIHADFLVNTTPVGMYPDIGTAPVDISRFTDLQGVLDIVYNPARTQLLMDAENANIPAMGGLSMLIAQAAEASEWFTGRSVEGRDVTRIEGVLRRNTENIILIGMPGCGKTTLGQALAKKLGRPFVDLDSVIEKNTGKTPAEIIQTCGEAYFRRLETRAAAEAGKASGQVIATGGGIVTQAENYPLLHQNGRILWLQRPLSLLETTHRPLSVHLNELFEARRPLYEKYADHVVDNSSSPDSTLAKILRLWEDMQ